MLSRTDFMSRWKSALDGGGGGLTQISATCSSVPTADVLPPQGTHKSRKNQKPDGAHLPPHSSKQTDQRWGAMLAHNQALAKTIFEGRFCVNFSCFNGFILKISTNLRLPAAYLKNCEMLEVTPVLWVIETVGINSHIMSVNVIKVYLPTKKSQMGKKNFL